MVGFHKHNYVFMYFVSSDDLTVTMTDRTSKNLSKFPKYGWKVKLDHRFPEKRDQNLRPKFKQILPLIPMGIRYLKWWTGKVNIRYNLINITCYIIKALYTERQLCA